MTMVKGKPFGDWRCHSPTHVFDQLFHRKEKLSNDFGSGMMASLALWRHCGYPCVAEEGDVQPHFRLTSDPLRWNSALISFRDEDRHPDCGVVGWIILGRHLIGDDIPEDAERFFSALPPSFVSFFGLGKGFVGAGCFSLEDVPAIGNVLANGNNPFASVNHAEMERMLRDSLVAWIGATSTVSMFDTDFTTF